MGGSVLAIGECMVELLKEAGGGCGLRYGGDTFNTAVYLAREGVAAGYATALGEGDPFSEAILDLARAEGVATDAVLTVPGRLPGLYAIDIDAAGERRFFYWRQNAPARQLFELDGAERVVEAMASAEWVYFSGITLGIYSDTGLSCFHDALEAARAAGTKIAFDGNFRPALWGGDIERAREVYRRFLPLASLLLPSGDDERLLWGLGEGDDVAGRLAGYGAEEVVMKNGGGEIVLWADGCARTIDLPERVAPVDTTAAGDSFNAAYLAARIAGLSPEEAVARGDALARHVIMHRGAIVPRRECDTAP
ncbi:sugar kinase [Afifella sp. IM 167]|uniref:sugar kinase n=1 Tax=Afifella sp. IM 167 TaxID=2033586 RepID=UPI001CCDA0EB|nr:sugar kinase [Afifella sp. IM 167]MBZ8134989.1 ribokinase [Afifella sp. IM 167]